MEFLSSHSLSTMLVFIFTLVTNFFQFSQSATVVVDGVSVWKNPTVQVGDSVIFQHKYHCNLYIFQTRSAFNLCNFSQATVLTKPNSTSYIWHTSRLGLFYFSFNNGSAVACQEGQKIAIKVSLSPPGNKASSPELPPPMGAPPLSSGGIGIVSSSPAYPWPFQPRESTSPSPAPSAILPATSSMVPDKNDGIPFINSNPAVPLPTGEVDSATIRPIPTSGQEGQVVGMLAAHRTLSYVVFLLLLLL